MKEIVVNPDNLEDKDINEHIIIYNLLFVNSNNEILLINHHNTYYFIHEYTEKEVLDKYNIDINRIDPFLIKKKYVLDYPLIENKTLYENRYYLIRNDIDIDNGVSIALNDIDNVINENKYNNPKNVLVMEEIKGVVNYLKKEVINNE